MLNIYGNKKQLSKKYYSCVYSTTVAMSGTDEYDPFNPDVLSNYVQTPKQNIMNIKILKNHHKIITSVQF